MKTLADFKRELQIGTYWEAWHVPSDTYLGKRPVSRKQTNGIAFEREVEGEKSHSWFYFPKSEYVKFEGDFVHIYTINHKGEWIKLLTYKKAE